MAVAHAVPAVLYGRAVVPGLLGRDAFRAGGVAGRGVVRESLGRGVGEGGRDCAVRVLVADFLAVLEPVLALAGLAARGASVKHGFLAVLGSVFAMGEEGSGLERAIV